MIHNEFPPFAAPSAPSLADTLDRTVSRMRAAHKTHFGYPYNQSFEPRVHASLGNYLINNLGDPYAGSHCGSQVCQLERDSINWLMQLWQCGDPSDFWGLIGAGADDYLNWWDEKRACAARGRNAVTVFQKPHKAV
jgi:hypothetical protein